MLQVFIFMFAAALASSAAAQLNAKPPDSIQFAIIKTSDVTTREGLAFSGGSYFRPVKLNHVAILVRHPQGSFLFDTGLGKAIDRQFKLDMPLWAVPFFSYGPVTSARAQLDAAGYTPIKRVFLSHGHWDHASGLDEFPEADVWITDAERKFLANPHPGSVFPSQISRRDIKWKNYRFDSKRFRSFGESKDLFGDGSAVLVPLPGHTPGSVGLYLTMASGRQFLFVGDVIWKVGALAGPHPKLWIASKIVDDHAAMTLASITSVERARVSNPAVVIVPAHDAQVHDKIGYFPNFIK